MTGRIGVGLFGSNLLVSIHFKTSFQLFFSFNSYYMLVYIGFKKSRCVLYDVVIPYGVFIHSSIYVEI